MCTRFLQGKNKLMYPFINRNKKGLNIYKAFRVDSFLPVNESSRFVKGLFCFFLNDVGKLKMVCKIISLFQLLFIRIRTFYIRYERPSDGQKSTISMLKCIQM